jgi:hypothetical protein
MLTVLLMQLTAHISYLLPTGDSKLVSILDNLWGEPRMLCPRT